MAAQTAFAANSRGQNGVLAANDTKNSKTATDAGKGYGTGQGPAEGRAGGRQAGNAFGPNVSFGHNGAFRSPEAAMRAAADVAGEHTVGSSNDDSERTEFALAVFSHTDAPGWFFLGNMVAGSKTDAITGIASTSVPATVMATPEEALIVGLAHSHPSSNEYSPADNRSFNALKAISENGPAMVTSKSGGQRLMDFQFSSLAKTSGMMSRSEVTPW